MNIITILDNIILSDTMIVDNSFTNEYNIKEILIVELDIEQIENYENYTNPLNTNKITIVSNPSNINFEHSNNIILNFLSSLTYGKLTDEKILIVSKNNLLGFIVVVGFMIKYLKISLLECLILGMSKNINGLHNSIYIQHLNEYHLYLKNNFK